MNRKITKSITIILCTSLLACGCVSAVHTTSKTESDISETEKVQGENEKARGVTLPAKDETVYVLAGADGSVKKLIVSDWIKNDSGSETLSDLSALQDVESVRGNLSYTMNEEHMRVWNASGKDVYCQGNIDKELPVSLHVSYTLDGESISPTALAGKSGKVTIRFTYQNNLYENVKIEGFDKEQRIFVPFAMLSGLILDNDIFQNIQVTNGKLINDGTRTMVAGIAFPGLQQNLGLDREKLEIPDYVEITADAENFKMANTMTIATNEPFSQIETKKLNPADELTDSVNQLSDAMNQLIDGSSKLYDGLYALLDKSEELIDGIDQLAQGADALQQGTNDMKDGVSSLASGAQALSKGLGELDANSDTLNAGAQEIFEVLLAAAAQQLKSAGLSVPELTMDNYETVLDSAVASLSEDSVREQAQAAARQSVTEAVQAQKTDIAEAVSKSVQETINAKMTESVYIKVESEVLASLGMTKETYEAALQAGLLTQEEQSQIANAIAIQMDSEKIKAIIEANIDQQMNTVEIQATIAEKTNEQIALLIEENINSEEVQNQISAALEKAKNGVASIQSLKEQLTLYHSFYNGLHQYTNGVSEAKAGSAQLADGSIRLVDGSDALYAGAAELYKGILTLKEGAPKLAEGVSVLRNGAMQLSEGLKEFDQQGVQKLVSAIDGDLNSLSARLKATVEVSRHYQNFSSDNENTENNSTVKFIYRTEAVK